MGYTSLRKHRGPPNSVERLAVAPSDVTLLQRAGFTTMTELSAMSAAEIAARAQAAGVFIDPTTLRRLVAGIQNFKLGIFYGGPNGC